MNPDARQGSKSPEASSRPILVWDLPTRVFHWLLVALVITSFVTGKIAGLWMQYHIWCGCTIFGLLVFRLTWGFVGGKYARFSDFVYGPGAVLRYALTLHRRDAPEYLGHNPLGGWSVLAMLTTLLIQAVTGLFANDDIFTEGPLYPWVNKATSDWLTHIHRLNQEAVLLLVAVHVMAVLFHLIVKGQNLIQPMFTGHKLWPAERQSSSNQLGLAALIAGALTVGIFLLLR